MARSERMVGALWGSSITVICSYFSLISKLGGGMYDVHIGDLLGHDLHHNHVVCCEDLLWRGDLAAVDSGCSEVHFLQDYLTWFTSVLKMITILPLTVTIPLVIYLIIMTKYSHPLLSQGRQRSESGSGYSTAGTWGKAHHFFYIFSRIMFSLSMIVKWSGW